MHKYKGLGPRNTNIGHWNNWLQAGRPGFGYRQR